MRARMGDLQTPWPLVCDRCAFLQKGRDLVPGILQGHIEKIQVETTLACKLRCSGCNGLWQIKNLPGRPVLHIDRFTSLLEACRAGSFDVRWIEYCGQGEPLSNPKFSAFMEAASRILPSTRQRVITNGNFDFDERFPVELPDDLIVSCDGFNQHSYEQYRVNGDVQHVLRFMERAAQRMRQRKGERLLWKYILFSHNDSDEEIVAAQDFAAQIGVHQMVFIATHTANRSRRFLRPTDAPPPIRHDFVSFSGTPLLFREDLPGNDEVQGDTNGGRFMHVVVDSMLVADEGAVHIAGWAVGDYGKQPSAAWIVDHNGWRHALAVEQHRPDVANELPHWPGSQYGFSGRIKACPSSASSWLFSATVAGRELSVPLNVIALPHVLRSLAAVGAMASIPATSAAAAT